MKNITKYFAQVLLILCLALTGCIAMPKPEVLGDLVYTNKKAKNPAFFTVHLPEKESLEPYLVLKRDYDGGTLLPVTRLRWEK